ncbi:MAG: hypothetical protein OEZ58_22115, partial [Gammaproteobacteria bacterium]|nr:hypothetical protein [Gammaproteobacteria bacterium]
MHKVNLKPILLAFLLSLGLCGAVSSAWAADPARSILEAIKGLDEVDTKPKAEQAPDKESAKSKQKQKTESTTPSSDKPKKQVFDVNFDHNQTGFPLNGQHQRVDCAVCHINQVFQGTPSLCSQCHNNVIAPGQNLEHILTQGECNACHNETIFIMARMNHDVVTDQCDTCHNGSRKNARGKPLNHIPNEVLSTTNGQCDLCHVTTYWVPVPRFKGVHSTLAGDCVLCHNGSYGTLGKHRAHDPTTDSCEACHNNQNFSTVAWVDHTHIIGVESCNNCHVDDKPKAHIPTGTEQCGTCHTDVGLNWGTQLDFKSWHNVLVSDCANCHSGVSAAPAKPGSHILSTDVCENCHVANADSFLILIDPKPDHSQILGACTMCHAATPAPGGIPAQAKPQDHIPSTDRCDACHLSGATWAVAPSAVDHTQLFGLENCIACHNGVIASYKSNNHISIKSPELCETCHTAGGSWTNIISGVDHTQVVGSCESAGCHANDKGVTHIPAGNICVDCHLSTSTWSDVLFTHGVNEQVNCALCHNAVMTPTYKSAAHISSTDVCEACHNFNSWEAIKVDHAEVTGDCEACHLDARSSSHIATSTNCAACHSGGVSWLTDIVNHNEVIGACVDCHQSDYPATHIDTTNDCAACHSTAAWAPAITVNHDHVVGFCVDCHRAAKTTATAHINSSDKCEACHTTSTWKPAVSVDHVEVFGVCIDCHNRVIAPGKSDQHILSDDQCAACHDTNQFMPAAFVDHSHLSGSCSSCHSIPNITPPHPETVQECNACHSTVSWAEI